MIKVTNLNSKLIPTREMGVLYLPVQVDCCQRTKTLQDLISRRPITHKGLPTLEMRENEKEIET